MFEIEVTRPYSWCVTERIKWKLIYQTQDVMINGKASVWAAADTHENENHKDCVAS